MPKMPATRKEHGDAVLIASRNDFIVSTRSSGLDNGRDSGPGGGINSISKREEGVRCEDRPSAARPGLFDGDSHRVDATHLPGPDADNSAAGGKYDRIGL